MKLNATILKSFFQYGCDRQTRYHMMSDAEREEVGITQRERQNHWAQAGDDFEADVVALLSTQESVLRPPGREKLTLAQTTSFLTGESGHTFAHQLLLDPAEFGGAPSDWGVPDSVTLSIGFPDLVRVDRRGEQLLFRIIDVKAVHQPASFHKIQIAYYTLLLDEFLAKLVPGARVDPVGEVWHFGTRGAGKPTEWSVTEFRLKGYRTRVLDFLRRELPRIVAAEVGPDRDDTRFHLYFKCEQCKFLPTCSRSIEGNSPREWDVSAVVGLSQISKQSLLHLGIRTVGDLTGVGDIGRDPNAGWALRSRADLFRERAHALVEGTGRRREGRHTLLVPVRLEVGLFLVIDHDPVEGRLATVGLLARLPDGDREIIRVIEKPGPEAELSALGDVLSEVLAVLTRVDRHNSAKEGSEPWHAHLFVYEPVEARDLQDALGRHLDNDTVRAGLMHLIRMFPPEPLQPDPEYRGPRHLPASALRSVFDSLFALPTKVSHDLRSVSGALAAHPQPAADPYRPSATFARPFSSRLNIDCCRALKEGKLAAAEVEADVRARLRAMAGLTRWLQEENSRSEERFLRLSKAPFRFQSSFNPLVRTDLDYLAARELLADRVDELAALTALAEPLEQRRQRFQCLAPMRLIQRAKSPRYWAEERLTFRAPPDCRHTELGAGVFGCILTDGHPDLLLDSARWPGLFVSIDNLTRDDSGVEVCVDVQRKVWNRGELKRLLDTTPDEGWILDRAFLNNTGPRLRDFLVYLSEQEVQS